VDQVLAVEDFDYDATGALADHDLIWTLADQQGVRSLQSQENRRNFGRGG
jgi:hypothetical protein